MKLFRGIVSAAATLSTVLLGSGLLAAAPAQAASITLSDANCTAGVINGTSFSASTNDVVTITGNFTGCQRLQVGTRLVTSASDIVATGSGVGTPTSDGIFYVLEATTFTNIQITFTNTNSNIAGFGLGASNSSNPDYGSRRTQWGVNYTGTGGGGGSSSSIAAEPQIVEISLTPEDGTTCRNSSQPGTAGTWISLPGADDCTPPASKAGATLLGWATSPNFPVAIAKRQVDKGWGAYETFNDDGQLTGVFIPAGGATFLSGSGKLYTIWSE